MIGMTNFLIALQPTDVTEPASSEPAGGTDWWTSTVIGEPTGFDLLLLLGGVVFFGLIARGIYSVMLYNQVAANRHPANFRRVMYALWLLFSILWFVIVFFRAFGGVILLMLLLAWFALALFFIFTRRKLAHAKN